MRFTAIIVAFASLLGTVGSAQTLFQRPDTLPNYAAYQYADQCLAAVRRSIYYVDIKDTIWRDTSAYDPSRITSPISEEAIRLGRLCLSRMDIDSIPHKEYDIMIPVLLLIDRDEEVNRLIQKTLDTLKGTEKNSLYSLAIRTYQNSRPKRLELLQKLLAREDSPYKGMESEGGNMMAEVLLATTALDLGDTQYPGSVVREIVNEKGKYYSQLAKINPSSVRTAVYPLVVEVLNNQAMDSLAISTQSYRHFLESIWKKLSPLPFSDLNDVSGNVLPRIQGDFWFTNLLKSTDTSNANVLSDKVITTSSMIRPVTGKVNAIMFFQGGCHSQSASIRHGRNNGAIQATDCWRKSALLKRLKQRFPEMEITLVSKTFGSIGNSPPLEPKDEADTLAEYFLNFYKIPGVHIISETDFVRMPGYDRRRVDLEVDYENDLQVGNVQLARMGSLVLTDEHGQIFHANTGYPDRLEPLLIKKISAVMKRLSGKQQ